MCNLFRRIKKMKYELRIDKERCKGCVLCVSVCPRKLLRMSKELNKKGFHHAETVNGVECMACKQCTDMCPDVAIEICIRNEENKKNNPKKHE